MDYIINILTKTLHKEKASLKLWQDIIKSPERSINKTHQQVCDNIELLQQANGNIHSNEIRVNELEEALEIIQIHKKVTQQRNWQITGTLIEITSEGQRVIEKANKPKQQQFKKQH